MAPGSQDRNASYATLNATARFNLSLVFVERLQNILVLREVDSSGLE